MVRGNGVKVRKGKLRGYDYGDSKTGLVGRYDVVRSPKKSFISRFMDGLKFRFKSRKVMGVRMELVNGEFDTFIVVEKNGGFKRGGKKYLFDDESKYYDRACSLWFYDYHESFTLPIKRVVPVNELKKAMESSPVVEVEYAVNPSTLERFETSKIAEGIMKGASFEDFMRKVLVSMIILIIVSVLHLLLFMQKTGIFESIRGKLPF